MAVGKQKPKKIALFHQRVKIGSPNDLLAYNRIVELPFDLATAYSAAQNFRIDVAKGVHRGLDAWLQLYDRYFQEALDILQDQDCNLFPGNNDELWIHVKTIGKVDLPSERCVALMEIFSNLFSKDDPSLLKDAIFPCPKTVNTTQTIRQLERQVMARFCYH